MNEYYFHLDHLTVGYDKKPLIKDICIGIEKRRDRHADRTERRWEVYDSQKHHPPVKAGRRKCGV